MMLRRLVPIVLVIAVVLALLSLSYPSVVVSSTTIQPVAYPSTYTSAYQVGYSQLTASTVSAGYSLFTAWYPGNPICDPMSNACTPYPMPTATITYPQSATYTYQVALSSQITSLYTSIFTSSFTQTSFQTVPPYAAAGLTGLQYGVAALVTVAVVGLSIFFLPMRKRLPAALQPEERNSAVKSCQNCGTENSRRSKFCSACGARLG